MTCAVRIRVRVVHDHPVAEAGLSAAFGRCPDLEVEGARVGVDVDGPGAGFRAAHAADVVVADDANGMALAIQAARQPSPSGSSKIVFLATTDLECEIRNVLARGVRGDLLVGCALDERAEGVRAVHRGVRHLGPPVAARLAEGPSVEPLTHREAEVLRLVAEGMCNKAIRRRLGIAVGTVKSHLKSTFDKLDVPSSTQAVAVVERRGPLRDQQHAVSARRGPSAGFVARRAHVAPVVGRPHAECAA